MPPLTVLHEDERLLVCAKPPNLLTVPSPGGRGKGEETLTETLKRTGVEDGVSRFEYRLPAAQSRCVSGGRQRYVYGTDPVEHDA